MTGEVGTYEVGMEGRVGGLVSFLHLHVVFRPAPLLPFCKLPLYPPPGSLSRHRWVGRGPGSACERLSTEGEREGGVVYVIRADNQPADRGFAVAWEGFEWGGYFSHRTGSSRYSRIYYQVGLSKLDWTPAFRSSPCYLILRGRAHRKRA